MTTWRNAELWYVSNLGMIYNSKKRDYDEYLSHPVNSYLLMRRLTLDVDDISRKMREPADEASKTVDLLREIDRIPKMESFHQASGGFLKLQGTYELESKPLSRGILRSKIYRDFPIPKEPAEHLSEVDSQHLANAYLNMGNVEKHTEWMDIAESFEFEDEEEIDETANGDRDSSMPYVMSNNISEVTAKQAEIYYRLCRGERLRPLSWDRNLRCEYFLGHNAFYLIQPIKMEVLSKEPFIAQFYDVMNDKEIRGIQGLGTGRLTTALGVNAQGIPNVNADRISYNTWIPIATNNLTQMFNKKLEMLIGLRTGHENGAAEEIQLNNYGTGGLYLPHIDYLPPNYIKENLFQAGRHGNRIATFMYYLSDVPAGGATVFTKAGVTVWPKKGSGVFWWNLKRNGDGDELTWHGACPVLYGSKWVINRWIRSNEQMFIKKCGRLQNLFFRDIKF